MATQLLSLNTNSNGTERTLFYSLEQISKQVIAKHEWYSRDIRSMQHVVEHGRLGFVEQRGGSMFITYRLSDDYGPNPGGIVEIEYRHNVQKGTVERLYRMWAKAEDGSALIGKVMPTDPKSYREFPDKTWEARIRIASTRQ